MQRQTNGGSWTTIYTGSGRSYTDTIGEAWNTVSYRVRAYDATNRTSGYKTSSSYNLNAAPTVPSQISVPTLKAGKPAAISWGAATDPDGTIAAYELSRQVDGGAWVVVGTTAELSMTDAIGEDWTSVAYRVRAKDNSGAWSGYTTSEAVKVKSACGVVVVIDGVERELDELYCVVDGILRPMTCAAGIDGIVRDIF